MLKTRPWLYLSKSFSPAFLNLRGIPAVTMSTKTTDGIFDPPVCTLTGDNLSLNRKLFRKTVQVPAVHFDKKLANKCLKVLKSKAVCRKMFSFLRNNPQVPDEKVLILNPSKVSSNDIASLDEPGVSFLREYNLLDNFGDFELELEYNDWNCDEILRSLLPGGVEVPTGFSRIGHIVHLNLRPEQLKYKHVIGEVLIDKNPGVKTVVNKTGEINNEFRFFNMELLAGEDNMVATNKEHGHSFEFDFSKVYWNPRLSTEHTRIVELLNRGDVVYDVFAGVGPFAVPAAKKGCVVLANDLNPESYKWLDHNVGLNKIKRGSVRTFNMDGREFIKEIVRKDLLQMAGDTSTEDENKRTHVVMNLPSLAIDFLDVFPNLLKDVPSGVRDRVKLPTVHCHCFSKEEDTAGDVRRRIEAVLNHTIEGALIHDVRDVAPNKEMMCASFTMPADVVFGSNGTPDEAPDEPEPKKQRTK